jgi:hypothetical protein
MLTNETLKLIADDAKFQQNEQLKRKLIKLAHEVDLAKWARLNEGVNHERC